MRPADAVTLAGGILAGFSMVLGVYGYVIVAVHILFLSYAMDVLDGIVARKTGGGTREGLLLDRAFDRLSQVIAPLVLYSSWISTKGIGKLYLWLFLVYSGFLIGIAFWRLVYRVVWSLGYFAGLPLFVHALTLLLSIISGRILPVYIYLAMLIASALPVPYLRRLSFKSTPSPGGVLRFSLALVIAVIPYSPWIVKVIAEILIYAILLYAALGFLPPLLGLTPNPKSGGRPEAYKK